MAGRPSFKPTAEHRAMVESMIAFGVPLDKVAMLVKDEKGRSISSRTLTKYFSEQIETAKTKANFDIAKTLFQKAKSGDVTSMIFWLKTQARWRETDRVEITGAHGSQIQHAVEFRDKKEYEEIARRMAHEI
jgi:hypothetical protein